MEAEKIMRRKDIISSFFFLALGAFFTINALGLDVGTFSNPGPGLIPLMPGILLCVLSAALVFKSYKGKEPQREGGDSATHLADHLKWSPVVILTMVAMLVFAVAMQYLGFVVSSILIMLFFFKFIGKLTWIRSALGAALSVGICYLVFQVWLTVQFPIGPWGF
jgi:putative tricarboxylic transport membrane protein